MDEHYIVAAILNDRKAYDALAGSIDFNDFGEFARKTLREAMDFYERDPDARRVDRNLLVHAISGSLPNKGHLNSFVQYVRELPKDVSEENVVATYRALRRFNIGLEIANRLGHDEADATTVSLMDQWTDLLNDPEEDFIDDVPDLEGSEDFLPTVLRSLNEKLDGGVARGSSIIMFGRPHCGKTLIATAFAEYWAYKGERVLYLTNEDGRDAVYRRMVACGTRTPISELLTDKVVRQKRKRQARERHGGNLFVQDIGTSFRDVIRMVDRYQPTVVVIDQLRNLKGKSDNFSLDLDYMARAVKELALQRNLVCLSLVQAGESAEGKLHLSMGDVDWSNTGIPGAADYLWGIGTDDAYTRQHRRILQSIKNRGNGWLGHVVVYLIEPVMAINSTPLPPKLMRRYLNKDESLAA